MIVNFKKWKYLSEGRGFDSLFSSMFEQETEVAIDPNAGLIRALSVPTVRGSIIKRINAALKTKIIDDPKRNPILVKIPVKKLKTGAEFLDDALPPELSIKIKSLAIVEQETDDKSINLLNLFKSKEKLSKGWVPLTFKYTLDVLIKEVVLNEFLPEESTRTIAGISGTGIMRGKLVPNETGTGNVTQWEIIDLAINFNKPLDFGLAKYTFICSSVSAGASELAGKTTIKGSAIGPDSEMINVNQFIIKSGDKAIINPVLFGVSDILAPEVRTQTVDVSDLLPKD